MTQSKPLRQHIVESAELRGILQHCSYDTLGTFDIDNTLIQSAEAGDVGSDQWFYMLFTYAKKATNDNHKEALNLVLELNRYVQEVVEVKPVEEKMSSLILERLQGVGLPLMGLTARGPDLADITARQLSSAGIQFDRILKELDITLDEKGGIALDVGDPHREVRYQNGILYCDGADKGVCLNAFFKHLEEQQGLKKKYSVVMVDDRKANLENILKAAQSGGYSCTCMRLSAADNHVQMFDESAALEATAQFVHSKKLPVRAHEIMETFKSKMPGKEPEKDKGSENTNTNTNTN